MSPLVRIDGVTKRFGRRTVLHEVSLEVVPGEVIALVGENGAGKTTLLRICAGLARPTTGTVSVAGRCGYCPQVAGLFELLSADEHLVLFGAAAGLDKMTALAQGRAVLDTLRFAEPDRDRQVRHLSGGSRQKLNVALALLGQRSVLLLDEPYQGFDHGTYVNFWEHVAEWRSTGKAVVIVTHILAELARVDRVVELQRV